MKRFSDGLRRSDPSPGCRFFRALAGRQQAHIPRIPQDANFPRLRCAILCVRLHEYPAEEVRMRIADVMTRDLPTVEPGSSVREAASRMRERGVRALPVCEGTRLVGIVTDWDLAAALADEGDPTSRPL